MLAPTCKVDLRGFHELVGKTKARLILDCEDIADAGAAEAVEHAKREPRFRTRTGRLMRSIQVTQSARFSGREAIATASADTPYASHVEWGTVPHVIRAKRKPNLVFFWARMGRWFIGPKVNHPGTTGRYFMSRGARAAHFSMLRRWHAEAQRIGNIWR